MPMKNLSHPGRIVLWDCIEALNLTIGDAAVHPQVEEDALTAICERQAPITADMAIRLEMAFGSTANTWLRLQNTYDLAQARETACEIKRIERAA